MSDFTPYLALRGGVDLVIVLGPPEFHEKGHRHSRSSDTGDGVHLADGYCVPVALRKSGWIVSDYSHLWVPRWLHPHQTWDAKTALKESKARFSRQVERALDEYTRDVNRVRRLLPAEDRR